jgi:hypothetical protein
MKMLLIFLLSLPLVSSCNASQLIEKSLFPTINGTSDKAEYIDLNTNDIERLYIRYSPLTDSGVELEKTTNNVVVWRSHVQPIIPVEQQLHSKYCHEVSVLVYPGRVDIISAAGSDVGKKGGSIYAGGTDAKQVFETHSLMTGELISRRVSDLPSKR